MTTESTPQDPGQTTGITDNPTCTCCSPVQPLEPPAPGEKLWTCPVTGKKYMYDPADGVAREVNATADRQAVNPQQTTQQQQTTRQQRTTTVNPPDFFPQAPDRDEARWVNPEEPFA